MGYFEGSFIWVVSAGRFLCGFYILSIILGVIVVGSFIYVRIVGEFFILVWFWFSIRKFTRRRKVMCWRGFWVFILLFMDFVSVGGLAGFRSV